MSLMKTKIIALYLPQFHCIPENDEFWGKGFTDWVTVKNAKPLFKGHVQPKVPMNGDYYDLSIVESVEKQAKMAEEYGVYGFGVYHYWFNNEKNLLTKPAEILRDSENVGVKYFYIWDNNLWKRSWSNVEGNDWAPMADKGMQTKQSGPQILIPYILGKEPDWENHYNYVKTHFQSPNYEKLDNKPVFGIITYSEEIRKMCDYWNELAKKDGYLGIHFIFQYNENVPVDQYQYTYQPHNAAWYHTPLLERAWRKMNKLCSKTFGLGYVDTYSYSSVWKKLIKTSKAQKQKTIYHGGFVSYDDSPRRGNLRSKILTGANPQMFEKYMKELIAVSEEQGKPYVFLTAWNEWGEGAYIEPDTMSGMSYLEAVRSAIKK